MKKNRFLISSLVIFFNMQIAYFETANACEALAGIKVSAEEAGRKTSIISGEINKYATGNYTYFINAKDDIKKMATDSMAPIQECWGNDLRRAIESGARNLCPAELSISTAAGGDEAIKPTQGAVKASFADYVTGHNTCIGRLKKPSCSSTYDQQKQKFVEGEADAKSKACQEFKKPEDGNCDEPRAQAAVDQEKEAAFKELEKIKDYCEDEAKMVVASFHSPISQTITFAKGMGITRADISSMLTDAGASKELIATTSSPGLISSAVDWMKENPGKTALGAAAAGAGAMMLMNKKEKDEKEEKQKKAEDKKVVEDKKEKEFQAGFAHNAKGELINCQSPDNYQSDACRPVLLNFCGKSESAAATSCQAFQAHYCSQSNASQSFCMNHAAKSYCQQPGAYSSINPSCVWLSARPENCNRVPESKACLHKWSSAKMTEECPKFPNDPLCKAHSEGKDILQGADDGTTKYAAASANNFSSLINQTDQSSLANVNLFGASSAALSELCRTRQLTCR